jgi:carbon-monoxide dehydrogenase medium subunit
VKPPPFDYYAPDSLGEALELLGELGADAKPLAGGQSLVPLMNLRFAWPGALVDLNRCVELAYLRLEEGVLALGGMARQVDVERSADVQAACPLLVEALRYVGHPATRTRGTVGGSLAHSDPAAELPAVLLALRGEVVATSRHGRRRIAADDLFVGFLSTALEPGELITEVRLPAATTAHGFAFVEFARRFGDFALAGVAVSIAPGRAGIGLCGAAGRPIRSPRAEEALAAGAPPEEVGRLAAEDAEPQADVHGDAGYRRELVGVLTARAVERARQRAGPSRG